MMPNTEKVALDTKKVPILAAVVEIIKALRKGPVGSDDLMQKVKASRRTFYRALSGLKDADVVKEKGGEYYWHEHLETREYHSDFEAQQAVEHSRNVASGLVHLLGCRSYRLDLMPRPEYAKYGLVHLSTGYPEIYEIYEETEKIRKQIVDEEAEFTGAIKERLLSTSLKLVEQYRSKVAKSVAGGICEDIKEALRGRQGCFLSDLKADESGTVKIGAIRLNEKDELELIRQFILTEEAAKENKNKCMKIVDLESEFYTLRKSLDERTEALIMQVMNGTPLDGKCDLCPKVRVRSNTKIK
jgi:hypothetical protein